MAAHEWIEVKNRRWCIGCETFSQRVNEAAPWKLASPFETCPRNTVYARSKDGTLEQKTPTF